MPGTVSGLRAGGADGRAGLLPLGNFKGDVTGAVAATLVSLPLSMTIGVVAFMPLGRDYAAQGVMAGLYGAIILGFVTALSGRSVLTSGPRAASALVLASLIGQLLLAEDLIFPPGETVPNVLAIAFFAVLLAGAIQAACGLGRMADVVKNIPYPVIAGFINSSAILIILGQLWVLLDIRRQDSLLEIFGHLDEIRPIVLVPAAVTVVAMLLASGRYRIRMLPAPLAGMLAGTAVFYLMRFVLKGADVGGTLGEVEAILPTPQIPTMFTSLDEGGDFWLVISMVLPASVSMAALASLDTLLAASVLDDMTEERTDSNRLLAIHGIGNMLAALGGGLLGAGGMIRTKPGYDAGGRSKTMVYAVSAIMLAAVLLFGHWIEYIPRAVIAAMVVVLGFQLFDRWSFWLFSGVVFRRPGTRFTASLDDVFVVLLVIASALLFNLIVAVGVGLAVAFAIFVLRLQRSLVRRESRGPGLHARSVWNERRQEVLAECGQQIAVLELEGAVFFGSADALEGRVRELMAEGVTHIVLDMKRITDIDSTGGLALGRISRRLREAGGDLAISYIPVERRKVKKTVDVDRRRKAAPRPLWSALEQSGALRVIEEGQFHDDTDRALAAMEDRVIAAHTSEDLSVAMRHFRMPPVLRGLTRQEVAAFRRLATRQFYRAGETIFVQGDRGDALYYITRGQVDITIHIDGVGIEKRLQTLTEGSIFGEMAILDSKPRAASVIATGDTVCYRLGVEAFEKIERDYPEAALKLLNNFCRMFSERMRAANTMIGELEK